MAHDKTTTPAVVKHIANKSLIKACGEIPNAIMLLDSNTIDVAYTPAFSQFTAKEQQAISAAQVANPVISLERPLDANGKVDTTNPNMVIAAALQSDGQPMGSYHPALMGRLRQIPGGYLIYTHYHAGEGCSFSYPAFKAALTEYCMIAYALGAKEQPVVINLPGLQCVGVRKDEATLAAHTARVTEIIATTMFAGSTVYLVV